MELLKTFWLQGPWNANLANRISETKLMSSNQNEPDLWSDLMYKYCSKNPLACKNISNDSRLKINKFKSSKKLEEWGKNLQS
jgi:hypothetical protein